MIRVVRGGLNLNCHFFSVLHLSKVKILPFNVSSGLMQYYNNSIITLE